LGLMVLLSVTQAAFAQTDYRNIDAGQPLRIEDALVTPRASLDVEWPGPRVEKYGSGMTRWRFDPMATFGVASFSEIEVRVPFIYVVPPASAGARAFGMAGLAVGATHAFGVETPSVPAFAIGSEVLFPAGTLASPATTYVAKAIATKTFSLVRVHLNAGGGNYSVQNAAVDTACVPRRFPLPGSDPGCGAPVIPDIPCSVAHEAVSMACMASNAPVLASAARAPATGSPPSSGGRWFGGVGMDHAFGLSSTLVGVDVVAERFIGLYSLTDWTAEIGVRHQLNPQFVVDAGVSRKYSGVLQSTAVTVGGVYAFSLAR
jgi:hypothetical protein